MAYNPNQPRNPAGSDKGGEWRGSGAGPSVSQVKSSVNGAPPEANQYNAKAVDDAIRHAERRGGKVGGKERRAIHGLLKGWRG